MAIFGLGNFENDDALDFVGALARGGGPELVLDSLKSVADAPAAEKVGAAGASRALAAAEMVAAGRGRACDDLPSDAG
ncbi:MAG TPA: DUF4259 domain-containing protein, partial [bacterium]|nr:DUF4259 domain-containing protein [bacterium]